MSTQQPPTYIQSEAWLNSNGEYNEKTNRWTIQTQKNKILVVYNYANPGNILDDIAGFDVDLSVAIRAEMLARNPETGQRLCMNCDNWHDNDDLMCADCMKPAPDHISDDGKKVEAQTAIKHDSGKTRYSLLPWEVMENKNFVDEVLSFVANGRSEESQCCLNDRMVEHRPTDWFEVARHSAVLLMRETSIWAALRAVAEVFTSGAEAYGDYNWQRGLSETRRLDACRRHWAAYCCGEEMSDHGHHHLAHVLWYGLVGMWYDEQECK